MYPMKDTARPTRRVFKHPRSPLVPVQHDLGVYPSLCVRSCASEHVSGVRNCASEHASGVRSCASEHASGVRCTICIVLMHHLHCSDFSFPNSQRPTEKKRGATENRGGASQVVYPPRRRKLHATRNTSGLPAAPEHGRQGSRGDRQ
jgi:hypothetical protein